MATRITRAHLESKVDTINSLTGSPMKPYETVDGRTVTQKGNFHISGAYGGVCLHRMVNDGGGVDDVLNCGHVSSKQLNDLMFAFIRGIQLAQKS